MLNKINNPVEPKPLLFFAFFILLVFQWYFLLNHVLPCLFRLDVFPYLDFPKNLAFENGISFPTNLPGSSEAPLEAPWPHASAAARRAAMKRARVMLGPGTISSSSSSSSSRSSSSSSSSRFTKHFRYLKWRVS